jgi:hypothetical protein
MSRKMIVVLSLCVVLGLAAVGFAYASWQDTLVFDGTVTLGSLDTQLVLAPTPVVEAPEGENVGTCTALLGTFTTGDATYADASAGVHDKLTIAIGSAYADYSCDVFFGVTNLGSMVAYLGAPAVQLGAEGITGIDTTIVGCWSANEDLAASADTFTAFDTCHVHIAVNDSAVGGLGPYTISGGVSVTQASVP